ncbi:hypothetical protein [Segniliparus rugosus]|uniref:DUF7832 domain-containing protein n=1 Tax=Segniliparus rugosus (strain ATCC BAA-974 / DSM 45345 / CCUG 50838 / CIP 108380 / JCM 13579 / CDC 945) TaxID=679197 RepID=U1N5L0_SEGRC|nr:hypothetical protein [Segniliparus rugosus]ERG69419.1 hypothetical protein HMPREF9336_04115 [Segniliparus rugosus ATCC BAA-974]
MLDFLRRWLDIGDPVRPRGRLPELLAEYPPYRAPFPGDPNSLRLAECEENLRYLLSAREERLAVVGGLLQEFGLDARAGLSEEDPRPFLRALDRWALEEWPSAWTPAFPSRSAEQLSSPKEGERIALSMLMDVAILLGEIVVRRRPDYAWRLDTAEENRDMISHRRVVVAKLREGPDWAGTVLDFENICISEFDRIGRGLNYDVLGRRVPGTGAKYIPPAYSVPLGHMAQVALEGGYDPPGDRRAALPVEGAPETPGSPDPASPHVYDKAEYHAHVLAHEYGLDPEQATAQAAVPTAFFFGWLASRGLLRDDWAKSARQRIAAYNERRITAVELWDWFDRCLIGSMLSDEGNAFARFYFRFEGEPGYYDDLTAALAADMPSSFHVPYTFENQARVDAVVDARYAQWREQAQKDGALSLPPNARPARGGRVPGAATGRSARVSLRTACAGTVLVFMLTWAFLGQHPRGASFLAVCFGGAAVFLPLVFLLVRARETPGGESQKAACAQAAGLLVLGMLAYVWPACSMLLDGRAAPRKGDWEFFVLGVALFAAGVWRAPKSPAVKR